MVEPTVNPFESPRTLDEPGAESAERLAWCEDDCAVMPARGVLPRRCIYCNRTPATRVPWRRCELSFSRGVELRRTDFSLCGRHLWRVMLFPSANLVVPLGIVLIGIMFIDFINMMPLFVGWFIAQGVLPFLNGPSAAFEFARTGEIRIKNCGEQFLESLPTREELARHV